MRVATRVIFTLFVGLNLVACGDKATPKPGTICVLNSECNNPLSCTFGRCHAACVEARDCPVGQRCVKGTGAANICQLPDEQRCTLTSDCKSPLVCGRDLQCRNECREDRDCPTKTQKCVTPDNVCAELTELDPTGKLKPPSGTPATDAGAADAPASADSAVAQPDASARPEAAAADTAVARPEAAAPTDTAAPSPDAPASAADAAPDLAPPAANGPCGVPDNEPNNTRTQATPYAAGTEVIGCLHTRDDVDFYEISVPESDLAGGYFQFSVTDIGEFTANLAAFTVSDNGELGVLYADTDGQNFHFFLAGAPGQKYRFALSAWASNAKPPARYTMKGTYTKINDANEPNDTRDKGKPLALATPAMGYIYSGYKTPMLTRDEHADWFTVTLAAGIATVRLENAPMNVEAGVGLFDADGVEVGSKWAGNAGANITWMTPDLKGGTYHLWVNTFTPPKSYDRARMPMTVPDHFTRPYRVVVTQ